MCDWIGPRLTQAFGYIFSPMVSVANKTLKLLSLYAEYRPTTSCSPWLLILQLLLLLLFFLLLYLLIIILISLIDCLWHSYYLEIRQLPLLPVSSVLFSAFKIWVSW